MLMTCLPSPGAMNYPSTTQALFALIVMIIVLLFILVYCCWGTFSCARQDEAAAPTPEDAAGPNGQHGVRHILRGPHTVIVPINNMIYVGDPETHQIYQIPMDRDKPPAYTEVFRAGPPPPYRPADTEVSSTTTTLRQDDNRTTLPESPPAYECLPAAPEEGVSPEPLTPEPDQEAQNSTHRAELVLAVGTLSDATRASTQGSAEAGPSGAPPTAHDM